ncbi:MAG TPA: AAA family ATPase, partial [Kofleriaceae bacterium]|nr:AAA family ATPase [Kofleriaceae bacterium]
MRILAIRGQNLASLERSFEVALDEEPLASAGLFAITGNTGAGKSTLLDAMCAALFDRTPRLEGRSPFKVGRGEEDQRVGAFDVRALLRRGAGEGWAEVDFEGKDRRRYRARWEVHRARRRADGKLQDQQMLLRRVDDGVALGGTRGETLRAIESALGLSFEQFKRSALLAQGEFAAFLRAESSQRAALLERMTGTALYGALSIAAHRRGAELAAERRARRSEVDAAVVLDDERRAALEAEAAGAEGRT